MLSEIIRQFKEAPGPMDLSDLGRRLGVDRSALDGMLLQLVRQGKLREIGADIEACSHCNSRISCAQMKSTSVTGKSYELVV